MNSEVTRVRHDKKGVWVSVRSRLTNEIENLRADGVITVPLGVLKNSAVDFDPPLKSYDEALSALSKGHVLLGVIVR